MKKVAKNFAQTVRRRNNIESSFDIFELTKEYADLEIEHDLPFEFDAVCYFRDTKPFILLNGDIPKTRQRFTLAHEIGHIVMPGHKSIFACNPDSVFSKEYDFNNMDFDDFDEDAWDAYDAINDYYSKEKEANEFASELFLPEKWIKTLIYSDRSYEEIILEALKASNLSIQAVTLAVMKWIRPGVVVKIEHINFKGSFISFARKTYVNEFGYTPKEIKQNPSLFEILKSNAQTVEIFDINNYTVTVCYLYSQIEISDEIIVPNKKSTEIILDFLYTHHIEKEAKSVYRSINGILSNLNSRTPIADMSKSEYFQEVKNTFSKRDKLAYVVESIEFQQYIYKRYDELKAKNKI